MVGTINRIIIAAATVLLTAQAYQVYNYESYCDKILTITKDQPNGVILLDKKGMDEYFSLKSLTDGSDSTFAIAFRKINIHSCKGSRVQIYSFEGLSTIVDDTTSVVADTTTVVDDTTTVVDETTTVVDDMTTVIDDTTTVVDETTVVEETTTVIEDATSSSSKPIKTESITTTTALPITSTETAKPSSTTKAVPIISTTKESKPKKPKYPIANRSCKCELWVSEYDKSKYTKIDLSYLTYKFVRESIKNSDCYDQNRCGRLCKAYAEENLDKDLDTLRSKLGTETAGDYVCTKLHKPVLASRPMTVSLVATIRGCPGSNTVRILDNRMCCVGHFPSYERVDCSRASSNVIG